jgi:uncharacterized surface protein with fasciclin (FAS1) repeats
VRKIQRLAAVGAMAALTVALGACSNTETASTTPAAPAAPASSAAAAPTTEAATSGDGVTTVDDIFGPACSQVPTTGEGSAQGMVDDPVGTAASNNPLLTTLVQAVTAANLVDTLNDPSATYTVLAPANPAFEALPAGTLDAVLADQELLTTILTYHVAGTRSDVDGLVEAGTFESLQGGAVEVGGTADAPTFKGIGNASPATNLCGNIPTANATVFVIDQVLMPTAS